MVLTEKSMHCEARHITLNCVADGSAVAFVEPGDLYALFSNALDQAIDAAARQMDEPRRMISLLVCRAGASTVINIPSHRRNQGPCPGHPPTPALRLKVMRRIVKIQRHYDTENKNVLKRSVVLPPPKS